MGAADDLRAEVRAIFRSAWETRQGTVIPETKDLKLSNDAVLLDGTVLYADLAESTAMVNTKLPAFSAEVYKTFLIGAYRCIRARGGEITAFDGDRIMAVFIGNRKNTDAARAALHINWTVQKIVNSELKECYANSDYVVRHCVGVDTSRLFVARTGVRGTNDLVWVGRAANYAAKMSCFRDGAYNSWITAEVYDQMMDESKVSTDGRAMWEKRTWTAQGIDVYRSSWTWPLSN